MIQCFAYGERGVKKNVMAHSYFIDQHKDS